MTKYDLIAVYYDWLLYFLEKRRLRPLRRRFVPEIKGKTLDIAVGTGNNIEFYPVNTVVTLVDKSGQMLKIAKEKANKFDKTNHLHFVQTALESIPFQDELFDSILSIDVFCSVDYPEKVLDELYRVLKPDGKVIFVEHMKTGNWIYDAYLRFISIFTRLLASSSMIRPIDSYIRNSRFEVLSEERLGGSFRSFLCTKSSKKTHG